MTIAKRLAILILVAVAGLVVVGSFGLRQMGAINSNLQYAHENSIPSIRKVANMESSFLRLRVAVLGYLLSSEEQRPTYEKRIENSKQDLELHLRDYEKLISDDKDKQYLETSKGLVKDYLPLLDNAIVATKAGQPDKAKSGMGQAGELSKKIGENIEAHAKYNETLAEEEVQKAADAYSSGKVVSILVILLAT